MIDYNQLLGNYNSSFFSLHIFDHDIATYAHEYIHHIQNITTPYGLTYYASRQIYWLHELVSNPNAFLYETINSLWEKNKEMVETAINQVGRSADNEYHGEHVEEIVFNINKRLYAMYHVPIIEEVKIILKIQGKMVEVPFTVRMIKENMARIIQAHCFPESFISKNIIYYLIEEVIHKYSANFPINKQTVVALCDISLLTDSPIQAFFSFLDYLKEFESSRITAHFMYEQFQSETMYTLAGNLNIEDVFVRQLDICCRAVDAFYVSFGSESLGEWVKMLCQKGIAYRKKDISFLCNILNDNLSTHDAQQMLFEIVNALGTTAEIGSDYILVPQGISLTDFALLVAFEECTTKIVAKKDGKTSPCKLKKFCDALVRNNSSLVECGTRAVNCYTVDYIEASSIGDPVVNETCMEPLQRDMYKNLCPFTYVMRNIAQANQ